MKYMLLIYFDETWERLSLSERQQVYAGQTRLAEELAASGQYLGGNPLRPPTMATTVRVRDGKRLLTDGPFAETCSSTSRTWTRPSPSPPGAQLLALVSWKSGR